MNPRVKDLFDLPEVVHKIGFVEEFARAVQQPKVTAETYVVTPASGTSPASRPPPPRPTRVTARSSSTRP